MYLDASFHAPSWKINLFMANISIFCLLSFGMVISALVLNSMMHGYCLHRLPCKIFELLA